MAGDLRSEVDALGRVVHELLEGMKHVEKALRGSVEITKDLMVKGDELRRDLDKLLAACELMADQVDALTTKVCTIERKVYKLPDNVTVSRPHS